MAIELYGGTNSAINNVALDTTAFALRSSLFTIQFYASANGGVPPFPSDGFAFVDGTPLLLLHTLIRLTHRICLGMVSSIVDNEPGDWDYGCVLDTAMELNQILITFFAVYYSAYTNYIDDQLVNCKFQFFFTSFFFRF